MWSIRASRVGPLVLAVTTPSVRNGMFGEGRPVRMPSFCYSNSAVF
jgi:hypothetical protein